jgi:phosphoribosylamine-glycine ligase
MNILLLGGGGREHALAWKLAQSPRLGKLHAVPGNPGIADHATCHAVDLTDHGAVIALCTAQNIDLVVVGPEAPLVDGLADSLRGAGISVFGPSQAAAQLEGSKGFTKDLCTRAGIPTAAYLRTASRDEALAAIGGFGLPVVIKADGLAAIAPPVFSPQPALTVVMAANGYPGTPQKGGMIAGLADAERQGAKVFHAGTVRDDQGVLRASGGRVLTVSARGATVRAARDAAYAAVDAIDFPQGFCRRDIGWREIAREAD